LEAGKFLKDLLYQADNIRVPGLGTFVSTYQNAQADILGKKISPPAKSFMFDDSRKEADDLLWSWISEQEGINEGDAKMMLADFVADINHEIHEGRDVIIDGLGTFSCNAAGRTEFHFSVENNFNAESIGFSDIELPDSIEETLFVQNEPLKQKQEELKPAVHTEHEVQATHTISEQSPVTHNPAVVNRSKKKVWITFLLIIVVAGLTYLAFQQKSRIKEMAHTWFSRGKVNPADTLIRHQKADSTLDKTLAEHAKMKKALDVQSIDSTKVFIPYGSRQMKFYIVAASFTNYDYALKFRDGLKGKGFDSEIVTITHMYYKVTMGSYTEKQQALVELEKLKTITRNNTLWLLHI
jgi:cell division protein FtsN